MTVADKLNFIIKQNEKNKLSHAFLIETNNIEKCYEDILLLCKIINCNVKYTNNCDKCNLCKLIDLGNLPSLVVIEPDGLSIKKNQMLDLEKKFALKPIYSKYNVYIIKYADKLNDSSSNTILKFLEEPENNIIGFFIVNNKENVLSTIKSRCEITHVDYEENKIDDFELKDIALEYMNNVTNSNDVLVNKKLLNEYNDRINIEKIFNYIFNYYFLKYKNNINDNEKCIYHLNVLQILKKILNLIQYNVNLELLLDSFVIEMRRING